MDKSIQVKIIFKAPESDHAINRLKGLAGIIDESPEYPMERKYTEFNNRFFQGKLPKVKMSFAPLKYASGKVEYKITMPSDKISEPPMGVTAGTFKRSRNAYVNVPSIRLILSNVYHREEQSLDAILIHEMIHIYLLINGELQENHGPKFRQTAKAIEAQVGYPIPLTDDVNGLVRRQERVIPIAVMLMQLNNDKWVFGVTSQNIARRKLADIEQNVELAVMRRGFKKAAVILIATEMWFKLTAKKPASRFPEKFKDLYYVPNMEAVADLHEHGTVVFSYPDGATT